jgi:predicted alpha-1,6-mannanase (GH76 family)
MPFTVASAALIAARLYRINGNQEDLDWAVNIYKWERENLFNPATGAIYDNVNGETGELSTLSLSYNQGTFLGAAYELYKITGEESYLKDARKAANFAISNSSMIDTGNNLLRDEGDGDGGLFKGIFMRYYVQLIMEPNLDPIYKKKFITFFNNNAEILWRKGINKLDLLYNTNWAMNNSGNNHLTTQTSGCTLIEAKALFEKSLK